MGRGGQKTSASGISTARRKTSGATPSTRDYQGWSSSAPANEARIRAARISGDWVPGANGTERPFRASSGARLLWCWRPATGQHLYLNCETDILLDSRQASEHLGDPAFAPNARLPEATMEMILQPYLAAAKSTRWRDLNRQRFQATSAARFHHISSLGRAVKQTLHQRGSLGGDDRAELLTLGASTEVLATDRRYLKFVASGIGAYADARQLPEATPLNRDERGQLTVAADVPGAEEFIGTLVLPAETEAPVVLDCYPGPPRTSTSASADARCVGDLLALDQERVWLRRALLAPPPVRRTDAFSAVIGDGRGAA